MAKTDPSPEPENPQPEPVSEPGRLRAAWSVLNGQRLVPVQIQFEWLSYQQIFNEILTKFSAQLARSVKAEKKRISKQLEVEDSPVAAPPPSTHLAARKDELRARFAAARGIPVFSHLAPPASPTNGDEP